MSDKKPYSPPQLFRVELNHDQAILASCSLMSMNAMAGATGVGCVNMGCKIGNPAGDMGGRVS